MISASPSSTEGGPYPNCISPKNLDVTLKAKIPADSIIPPAVNPIFKSPLKMSVRELYPHGKMGLAVSWRLDKSRVLQPP